MGVEPQNDEDREAHEQLCEALVRAATDGELDKAKAALAAGAEADYDRSRALRRAASNGHDDVVEWLIENGADVHALTDEALRYAASNARTTTVVTLLIHGADANALEGEPLIKAATHGDPVMVRALLKKGADVHASDDQALRRAAFGGYTPVVSVLLAHQADPFAMFGSAIELAQADDHRDIIQLLAEEMHAQRSLFTQEVEGLSSTRDFLRATYQETGEPALVRAVKMNCLTQVVDRMKATGDRFTAADLYELKDRDKRSFVTLAADRGQLAKVFDLDLWHEDFADMQKAWDKLPPKMQKKSGVSAENFASIVAEIKQRALRDKANRFKLKPPGR